MVSRAFTYDMGLFDILCCIDAKMFKITASQFVLDAKLCVDCLWNVFKTAAYQFKNTKAGSVVWVISSLHVQNEVNR